MAMNAFENSGSRSWTRYFAARAGFARDAAVLAGGTGQRSNPPERTEARLPDAGWGGAAEALDGDWRCDTYARVHPGLDKSLRPTRLTEACGGGRGTHQRRRRENAPSMASAATIGPAGCHTPP